MRTGPGGDFLAVPAETGHGAAVAHEDPRPLRGPPARPGPRERTAWRERCVSGARPPRVASVLRGGRVPAFRRPHGPAVSGGEAPCQRPRAASQRVLNARPHLCLMDAKTVAVPVEGDARRRRRRPGRAVPLCVGACAMCAPCAHAPLCPGSPGGLLSKGTRGEDGAGRQARRDGAAGRVPRLGRPHRQEGAGARLHGGVCAPSPVAALGVRVCSGRAAGRVSRRLRRGGPRAGCCCVFSATGSRREPRTDAQSAGWPESSAATVSS